MPVRFTPTMASPPSITEQVPLDIVNTFKSSFPPRLDLSNQFNSTPKIFKAVGGYADIYLTEWKDPSSGQCVDVRSPSHLCRIQNQFTNTWLTGLLQNPAHNTHQSSGFERTELCLKGASEIVNPYLTPIGCW